MKSILDRSFRYVPSHATDIRKTFERLRGDRPGFRSVSGPVTPATPATAPEIARPRGLRKVAG
jgi:hypothetical protein